MNILDRYGIKEVADVTFYKIDSTGKPQTPVLFLDTLKVSTIEQTASTSDAKGGKGNSTLISWDFGKEINVTLTDALFSAKSMALMFGGGDGTVNTTATTIMRTVDISAVTSTASSYAVDFNGKTVTLASTALSFYDNTGATCAFASALFATVTVPTTNIDTQATIQITPDSFPGTYYVSGDTYARSEKTGEDEFFQFIIPKAKVQAQNTITLQAEGDPSTFNLNLRVLRPADGQMMKLIKYNLKSA
jgi:hypothetical protein